MFGLLLSGRLVDTGFRQMDPSHAVIDISDVSPFNHVVVFLTGQLPFPDGMGGAVYFSWPDPLAPPTWQFLGSITNAKPSAIFKVAKLKTALAQNSDLISRFGGGLSVVAPQQHAQLGIAMEPLLQLQGMTADSAAEPSHVPTFLEFSQKMVDNLFNYTSSFALTPQEVHAKPSETYVPYSALQNWYSGFERRLQQNPYFWRS